MKRAGLIFVSCLVVTSLSSAALADSRSSTTANRERGAAGCPFKDENTEQLYAVYDSPDKSENLKIAVAVVADQGNVLTACQIARDVTGVLVQTPKGRYDFFVNTKARRIIRSKLHS